MPVTEEKRRQIIAIVRAMNLAGMPANDIKNNLKEMNLTEEETEQIIAQARTEPTTADVHAAVTDVRGALSSGEHLKPLAPALEEQRTQTAEIKEKVEAIHAGVEEHAGALEELAGGAEEHRTKLEDIRASLAELHGKHAEIKNKVGDVAQAYADMKEIKELLLEMKPAIAALTSIDQKILETNREMLMRLKKP